MGKFWRENWAWIVAPFVLIVIAVVVILFITEGDAEAPFVYNVF